MKNRLISGIVFLIFGLLIALGPQIIFPVCGISGETAPMKCHWTARAELGAGLVIAFQGLLLLLFSSRQIRLGLNLAIGFNGVLALLLPTILIGVCGSTRMNCRSLTLPALVIFSTFVIAGSVINGIYLYQTGRTGGSTYGDKTTDDQSVVKK